MQQRLPLGHGDALSQLLKLIRPCGDTVFRGELKTHTELAFPSGPAGFLHLLEGEASVSQHNGQSVLLRQGDLVLLLDTNGYTLRDQTGVDTCGYLRAEGASVIRQGGQAIRRATNHDIAACFLAGAFHFDGRPLRSLLSGLPGLIHLKCDSGKMRPWLATLSQLLNEESSHIGPGSSFTIPRLIELLVIRALRTWSCSQGDRLGWVRGLSDERIGRTLNAMHLDAGRAWTVESLAEIAAMSRSVFSRRFTSVLGIPPLRYLTKWRLSIAAGLLRTGTSKVIEIAHNAGYSSEAAFSRAFKAQFGYPPRETRRIAQAVTFRATTLDTRSSEGAAFTPDSYVSTSDKEQVDR
ncbi:AraC family transcriptional regulator [Paraburkholderia humisilvae]|uniref:RCS-specific HTH-type transcriptional activator RclR n=2 Tax=Paraburkholderia humisilvae TaxID=627669 RepID=A0A6J5CYH3_9BURK|nr:RCS-specific HTH-type transcriptional activator RclR [Paraburkholderia humisilvae]